MSDPHPLDAARATALVREAEGAGLMDHSLLKIAKADLPPVDALADLRTRFPGAFRPEPPLDARNLSPAELAEAKRKLTVTDPARVRDHARMKRFWADTKAKYPDAEIPPEYR